MSEAGIRDAIFFAIFAAGSSGFGAWVGSLGAGLWMFVVLLIVDDVVSALKGRAP